MKNLLFTIQFEEDTNIPIFMTQMYNPEEF